MGPRGRSTICHVRTAFSRSCTGTYGCVRYTKKAGSLISSGTQQKIPNLLWLSSRNTVVSLRGRKANSSSHSLVSVVGCFLLRRYLIQATQSGLLFSLCLSLFQDTTSTILIIIYFWKRRKEKLNHAELETCQLLRAKGRNCLSMSVCRIFPIDNDVYGKGNCQAIEVDCNFHSWNGTVRTFLIDCCWFLSCWLA